MKRLYRLLGAVLFFLFCNGSFEAKAQDFFIFGASDQSGRLVLNGTIEVPTYLSGWYQSSGLHSARNTNYICGVTASNYYRNFFVFDLSGITDPITSAVVEVRKYSSSPATGYATWQLYDVTTSLSDINTDYNAGSAKALSIFNDLGTGTYYGNGTVDGSLPSTEVISTSLNSAAITAINSKLGSTFILGGRSDDFLASQPPSATTTVATNVAGSSATLNGLVNPNGTSTTVSFRYGTSSGSLTSTVGATPATLTGSSEQTVSATLTGLVGETTYYYQVVATNAEGAVVYGLEQSFTTVMASNTPPVANNDGTYNVNTGGTVSGNVLTNDTDADGDDIDVTVEPTLSLSQGSFTSFDLETGAFVYQAPTNYVGTFTFSYTATDGTATDDATATITVADTIVPVVTTKNISVQLDASGSASITTSDIDNGSTDNIGITGLSLDETSFDCSNVGANTVSLTAVDAAENSASNTATVTVEDNIDPSLTVQNITVQLDASGSASITAADLVTSASDNCTVQDTTINVNSFDCGDIGSNLVQVTLNDVNGNSTSKTATVTVEDNIDPTLTVQNLTVQLDASGQALIVPSDLVTSALDNCNIQDTTLSVSSFDCGDIGSNSVQVILNDVNGNSTSKTATVTVEDNIDPSLTVQNITVQLDASGNASITAADLVTSATDNCTIQDTTIDVSSFDCGDIGSNLVQVTLNDVNGNSTSKTATVTVEDDIDPTLTVQNLTVQLDASGQALIVPSDLVTSALDNCNIQDTTLSVSSFDCGDIGSNLVQVTLNDVNGNSTVEVSTVTILDTIAPVAMSKDTTVYLDETGNVSIDPTFVDNGSSDNCSLNLSLDITDFDCSNIGENTVILTSTDASENIDTSQAIVTVFDTIAPVALCRDISVSLDASGSVTITPDMIDDASYDVCSDVTLAINSDVAVTLDCKHVGENELTLNVTDSYGNMSTCVSTVTVEDNTKPIAICKDITVYLDETGHVMVDGTMVDNGSNDACGIRIPYLNRKNFYCSDLGENQVTMTVSDFHGNYDFCETTVTVADSIKPEIDSMDDISTVVASADECSAVVEFETPTATDICAGVTVEQTAGLASGSEFPVGTTVVTFTATDASGNTSESSFVVTVAGINKAPVVDAIADQSISLYATTLDVPLSGISAGDDCIEQLVSSITAEAADPSLVTGATVAYTAGDETAVLNLMLAGEVAGSSEITVTLKDEGGTANGGVDETSTSFTLTVLPNSAPEVVGTIDTVYIDKNSTEAVDLPAESSLFSDADEGDELAISATAEDGSALPDWISMSEAEMKLTLAPTAEELGEHKFMLTATDKMGATASFDFIVVVQIPTGFDELVHEFGYRIYPNPTDGFIKVDVKNGDLLDGEVLVRNIVGQEVHRQEYQLSDPIMIDLSGQVNGIYFVTLKLGDQEFTEKIIKK